MRSAGVAAGRAGRDPVRRAHPGRRDPPPALVARRQRRDRRLRRDGDRRRRPDRVRRRSAACPQPEPGASAADAVPLEPGQHRPRARTPGARGRAGKCCPKGFRDDVDVVLLLEAQRPALGPHRRARARRAGRRRRHSSARAGVGDCAARDLDISRGPTTVQSWGWVGLPLGGWCWHRLRWARSRSCWASRPFARPKRRMKTPEPQGMPALLSRTPARDTLRV